MTLWKHRLAAVAMLATVALATPVMAKGHNFVPEGEEMPLSYTIDALEHGYLTALQVNTGGIVTLARAVLADDAEAMAYVVHIEDQAGLPTLFGLLPDWQNADSPIHVPMHDKLATAQQLLNHMAAALPDAMAVQALVDKVAADRLTYASDVSVCRASSTPFTTLQTTGVEWGRFATHGPSLSVVLGGAGMLAFGGLLMLETAVRRRKDGAGAELLLPVAA